MVKVVIKEYDVLEGTISNSWSPQPSYKPPWQCSAKSNIISLPDRSGNFPNLPAPKDRYSAIQLAISSGLAVGTKVVRVIHMNKYYITNPRMIGTVIRYTFNMFPNETLYKPVVVRFESYVGYLQDIPFNPNELETLANARKQLGMPDETIVDNVIKDIERERSGVVPIRCI